MSKLTYEDKKEIVRLYDKEHIGYVSISKKIMISAKVVERIKVKLKVLTPLQARVQVLQ